MAAPVSDLHKSAFWIWGVTAMIMREPLGAMVRQLSANGIADPNAQLTCLRTAVTLLVLSRQFLVAGMFFDRVYMRPDAVSRFPSRNYPLDFLSRLMELLLMVGASTAVAIESKGLSPFATLTLFALILESAWYAIARAARFSTAAEIAPGAAANLLAFVLSIGLYATTGSEQLLLAAAALCTTYQLARGVRSYGQA